MAVSQLAIIYGLGGFRHAGSYIRVASCSISQDSGI